MFQYNVVLRIYSYTYLLLDVKLDKSTNMIKSNKTDSLLRFVNLSYSIVFCI